MTSVKNRPQGGSVGPASGRLFPSIIAGICAAGICPSPTDSSVPDKIRTILYKKPFPQKVKRKSSMPEGSVTVSTVIESIRRTWDLPGVLSEVKLVKSCGAAQGIGGGTHFRIRKRPQFSIF